MVEPAQTLTQAAEQARACQLCAEHLPLGPRPAFRVHPEARLLIVGQAPGTRVHETGIPWNDPSGKRLRDWLQIEPETFYDESKVAILPMGFCYPGVLPKGGDRPPRPECAPLWHQTFLDLMAHIRCTLLIGQYAQARYLGDRGRRTLTETVAAWADFAPEVWPLPHPSWRNTAWLKRNPWFESNLLGPLRATVRAAITDSVE